MKVTDVRISLATPNDRLLAYASVTFDGVLVVHDLRIVNGPKGVFVSMPNRRVKDRCEFCRYKNPLAAKYCGMCGKALGEYRPPEGERPAFFRDIVHAISSEWRNEMSAAVLAAYRLERERTP